ncbi:axonemal dynein light chain domain-containing protein 1-like [Watersipora subatra]|uniref:axonemal dynein light chain domain-containing protein 1-like n=1 Tax=Watersipora subatra TaxID=2589382 RepID=UPI00355C2AD9
MATTTSPASHATGEKLAKKPPGDVLVQLDKTLDRNKASERKPLPDIRKSKTAMEVAHTHNDFLPDEVMMALTQPSELVSKTLIPTREKALAISTAASRKPPANVWNHKSRRDKLKHLTDQAVCFCGAGRDISFLYDVPAPEEVKPTPIIKKDASMPRDAAPMKKPLELADSLVPDEYHIVKNKGVLGLEYYDSDYTTQPEDHEAHLTVFPSMKPTSRYEVIRLKEVMEEMMEKSGVNDEALESVGPTQMHNLIELIKKEQKIYNIIFHELIRQSTIECTERGELLADIRQKYSDLLSKVPRQIRGLHDEVMAQRALDRRLTEEMFRFKAQILALTSELTEVKEHDKIVTEQAKRAQEDLRSALIESQKNASLLGEYHDLYELQRQRLEKLVTVLTAEKELWSTATYSLSIKVVEEGNMVTARRAYIAEKAWSKLAHHFTVLLSDKDTEMLTRLQEHMEKWRDLMETFHIGVKEIEDEVRDVIKAVKGHILRWIDDFKKNCLSKEGAFVKSPSAEKAKEIHSDIKEWSSLLQTELDKFSGSVLLTNNDALTSIEHEISGWTECGVEVFNRHRRQDEYPNDYRVMIKLNKTLRDMCQQYSNRVTGENGIAKYIIQLNTNLEVWENKLTGIIHTGQNLPQREWMSFMEQLDDWTITLDNCMNSVGSVTTEDEKEKGNIQEPIDVHEMMRKAHMWSVTTNNSIDSEDSKYVEQVVQLHTQMVKWMVHVLLRLAPDRPGTSMQSIEQSLVNSPPIIDLVEQAEVLFQQLDTFSLLIHKSCEDIVRLRTQDRIASGDDLAEKELNDLQGLKYEAYHWIYAVLILITELTNESKDYKPLDIKFDMSQFSKARTATSHVLDYMESRKHAEAPTSTAGDEEASNLPDTAEPEKDAVASSKIVPAEEPETLVIDHPSREATIEDGEKEKASPLAATMSPIPPSQPKPESARTASAGQTPMPGSGPDSSAASPTGSRPPSRGGVRPVSVLKEEENLSQIEVIGRDDNTRPALLPEPSPDEPPPRPSSGKPMAVDSQKAYDALKTVQKLQVQLLETEQRAQKAEESEARKSAELDEALQRLRALERQMEEQRSQGQSPASKTPNPPVLPKLAPVSEEANAGGLAGEESSTTSITDKTEPKRKSSKSGSRPTSKGKKK